MAKNLIFSDSAEFKSQVLKTIFLAKDCNHINVPKGEHHAIGKAESAVSELDKMTRATIHEANLSFNVWDVVVEQKALLDSMTTYATNDSSQSIFDSVYTVKLSFDSKPTLDALENDLNVKNRITRVQEDKWSASWLQ